MDTYSSSINQPMTDFELSMKSQVKDIRSLVSRHGAKVPSTFTLLDSPAGTGFGSNSNNGSNNGHYNNGVTEDFSQQKNVQLLFLCMEEPITENTLFATTLPTYGEFYIILDIIKGNFKEMLSTR